MELRSPTPGLISLVYIIYGLHFFSAITGVLSPALVVTAFLTGWPSVIGIVLSYAKQGDAEDTYLASHFTWMIRTFWFAFLWVVVAGLLIVTIIASPLGFLLLWCTGIWVLYRIVRGVLCLLDDKPVLAIDNK